MPKSRSTSAGVRAAVGSSISRTCAFCDNALYRIGRCDYAGQLVPLAHPPGPGGEEGAEEGSDDARGQILRERAAQEALLEAWTADNQVGAG